MLRESALVNTPDYQASSSLQFTGTPLVKGSGGWTFDITKIRVEWGGPVKPE